MQPPIRIGKDQAGELTFTMLQGAGIYAAGAGGYGRKRLSARSVPIALRLVTKGPDGNPNAQSNQRAVIPLGHTRRKQGYRTETLFGGKDASTA
jgi:hypothetical protein